MGWGGIIAGAALGGLSGVGSAITEDTVSEEKERMQRERDIALADLQRRNQIDVHAANTKADISAIGSKRQAESDAAAATAEQDAATEAKKITSSGKAKAKLELDPEVQAAEQAKALNTAKGQAAASKYIEENRTPEQQKKAKLELDKIQAQINKENAEAGASGAHAKYYGIMGEVAKQNAETKESAADAKAGATAAKEDKWVQDKTEPTKFYGPGGIVKVEVEPAQMPTAEVKSNFLGLGGKAAKPYKAPTYVYTTPSGTELSYAEVAKVLGGKAEDFARTESDKTPSAVVGKPPSARPPGGIVPPGYRRIGVDKITGRVVYENASGEQFVQ